MWVVSYETQSGDKGILAIFKDKPCRLDISILLKKLLPEEEMVDWDVSGPHKPIGFGPVI